ncbi:helix-turn-helix transcriptional regulator [Kitasatospora sp. NPDC088351]|uniref:helix-turn-helix domain-containing protein n=1 Tax=Kitasatospora sp. NPDC088351 TaxID=3155180 RepID=UPI0034166A87
MLGALQMGLMTMHGGLTVGGADSRQRLEGEENVARRIKMEREARGWSTATLAERLTEAGYPLNQSAVWRIESGEPRRRVNLDEAIGFAKVFDISLDNLVGPPEIAANAHVKRLLAEFAESWQKSVVARKEMDRARDALDAYGADHPNLAELISAMITRVVADEAGGDYGSQRLPPGSSEAQGLADPGAAT